MNIECASTTLHSFLRIRTMDWLIDPLTYWRLCLIALPLCCLYWAMCVFSLFSRSLSLSLSRHVRAFPLAAVCTRLHYVCSVHSVSIHCQRSIHWSYTMQTEATNKTKTITSQNAKNGLKWTISIRAWNKHWIATANNNNNETKKKREKYVG